MSPPDEDPVPGQAKKPFSYVTVVGVVFVLIVIVALINLLRTEDSGTVGIGDVGVGEKVAAFAVPIVPGGPDGDANIDAGRACSVEGAKVIRICDYFGKPLVISFWFTKGSSICIEQQDVFDRVARRYRGRVGAVSINVRDDRDRVEQLVAEHDWRVPVGHDRDGAVSNIYRVGGCPTFLFVEPGGILEKAEIQEATAGQLDAQIRSLIRASAPEQEKTEAAQGSEPEPGSPPGQ